MSVNDSVSGPWVSRPKRERRRFPRYPSTLFVELKTSDSRVLQGSLLNISRGGAMVETERVHHEGGFLRMRVGEEGDSHSERLVLFVELAWRASGPDGSQRCGVVFLERQREGYERLRRLREVMERRSVAKALGLKFVELTPLLVERRALRYVNRNLAFSLNCVPLKLRGEQLMVAMAEPGDTQAIKKIETFSGCRVVPVVATPWAIGNTLIQCWGRQYVPFESESMRLMTKEGASNRRSGLEHPDFQRQTPRHQSRERSK